MLDEFKVCKPAGFPDHPHRGFETVSSPSNLTTTCSYSIASSHHATPPASWLFAEHSCVANNKAAWGPENEANV